MSKRPMMLLSIVERDKGKKLIKVLEGMNIKMNFQCVGFGTAPTEMMDIFGLGSNDKDIIFSLASETTVKEMMSDFGTAFESHTKYGGLMIILRTCAAGRILTELIGYNVNSDSEKEESLVKNEHHNNLIMISVNDGYSDDVMVVARKSGAMGGTVIKGRLTDTTLIAELENVEIEEDREILLILAPLKTSQQIMENINREFGINSKANGIITAIPTEKAYKI